MRAAGLMLFMLWVSSSHAMTFYASPPTLYLGGAVVESDWAAWQDAMRRFDNTGGKTDDKTNNKSTRALTTVVMHASDGGDSNTARMIGRDIRKRKLATVVYGRCSSACASMFLGGSIRQFSATSSTLAFHGTYNKTTKALIKKPSSHYFVDMTDGKMNDEFFTKFMRLENKKGFLRFVHPSFATKQKMPLAMLCKGDELAAERVEKCERLVGVDALKQGVVTTWVPREITAPPAPNSDNITVKSWGKNNDACPERQSGCGVWSTSLAPVRVSPSREANLWRALGQ